MGKLHHLLSFLVPKHLKWLYCCGGNTRVRCQAHSHIIGVGCHAGGYGGLKYFSCDVTVPSCPHSATSLSIFRFGFWPPALARCRAPWQGLSARALACLCTWHIGASAMLACATWIWRFLKRAERKNCTSCANCSKGWDVN